eukprot:CAMPEP_0194033526 /NCGR_PEP_ID=MMETSP0009_2-20130614/6190_1 /TAXON_ID=210454 /ORGANISM="Grammatophora oceanica, Strain CCMP 410" /LENGTH=443 /DNA_ID=CAMNT_0038674237 /DNA_START=278 /DNA_END=1609 /DNA_ORIENTATION=-
MDRSSETRPSSMQQQQQDLALFLKRVLASVVLSCLTLFSPIEFDITTQQQQSHLAPTVTVTLSQASALSEEQILVADVWKEVTRQYFDPTYNGLGADGWKQKRLDAVKQTTTLTPDDSEKVYDIIRTMLSALNDPYTRFLTPDQYESLTAYAKGGSAGIGVSLIADPSSGQVVVANTVEGGPAEKAGVQAGDVIVEVDGMDVTSSSAEVVAAKCRGEVGANLNIAIRPQGGKKVVPLTITRAQVKVNPVQASMISLNNNGNSKVGYIRISGFSQETTSQVLDALRSLKSPSALILDVRGNAGGYMPAGVDVAKLFLPPQSRIISEVDKSDRSTIYIADGAGSVETKLPLYVLVDSRTASASEIMTAALQDNERATIIGMTKTFGKGRIQNVQELSDGSGIAVTKAKYMTPNGQDIHRVGITPNVMAKTCGPDDTVVACVDGIL